MDAIVLAGGFGTRLKSVVSDLPKPMAPVCGRPFLEILLSSLFARGVERAIISVGYMANTITTYFADHPLQSRLKFEIEETPLGTGGAIATALQSATSDAVYVCNGDTYLDFDFPQLSALWARERSPVVVTSPVSDTSRFGRLIISENRILRFEGTGTPGPGFINAGSYVLPRDIFAHTDLPKSFSFEQQYLAKLPPGALRVFVTKGQFIDIGVPEDYRRAQVELAEQAAKAYGGA